MSEDSTPSDSNNTDDNSTDHFDEEISPKLLEIQDNQKIVSRDLVIEMEESYISYAMSVIVSRALPDVRDGLKPVHRRIIYAMHTEGLRSTHKYSKCAGVVGEVLKHYHPHGDSSVYDALVRMAQDFSLRYPLVDGQGNFGSMDGDNAAAMRYTEARMSKITELLLKDIDKETVDWQDNYDATIKEPKVLPTVIPQLLINGTIGIAVGMATSIPPHNLREVINATLHLLENPDAIIDELLEHVKGPDFPTAGELYDGGALKEMYHTGRGGVITRGEYHIEENKSGKKVIVFDNVPYQTNKEVLVKKIGELIREKVISGITALRDETNREGVRIVMEVKRDAFPNKIISLLFKNTGLQKSVNLNMVALVGGIHPRVLNLKEVLQYFLDHRFEVIQRRTEFELKVAKARAHILEGLKIALDHIDEVIRIIRSSDTKEIAGKQLQENFGLSDKQTKAILEMKLQTLAGLERKKIENELAELLDLIEKLESILTNKELQLNIIKEDLEQARDKFGDDRLTKIHAHGLGKTVIKDTIPNDEMLVVLTQENYIKRMIPSVFKSQKRGGVGISGTKTKEDDLIAKMVTGTNHNDFLFFTNLGRVFGLPVYEIPEGTRYAKGIPIVNLLQLQSEEKVTEILNINHLEGKYIFMCTTGGTVKKTELKEFSKINKHGKIACKLKEDETMQWTKLSSGHDDVFLVTKDGKSIRFPENTIRSTGRVSAGVRGIRLKLDDQVVEMDLLRGNDLSNEINVGESTEPSKLKSNLLVVMEKGLGKMTVVNEYRCQSRGGQGVKVASLTKKTGRIAGAKVVHLPLKGDLLIIAENGQTIRTPLNKVKIAGRSTQGVILMKAGKDNKIASISILDDLDEEIDNQEETNEQKKLL